MLAAISINNGKQTDHLNITRSEEDENIFLVDINGEGEIVLDSKDCETIINFLKGADNAINVDG